MPKYKIHKIHPTAFKNSHQSKESTLQKFLDFHSCSQNKQTNKQKWLNIDNFELLHCIKGTNKRSGYVQCPMKRYIYRVVIRNA